MKFNCKNDKLKVFIFLGVSLIATSAMAHQSEDKPELDMNVQNIQHGIQDQKSKEKPVDKASIVTTPNQDQLEAKKSPPETSDKELLQIMKQLSE